MTRKTKDRLITAGTVLVICAVGLVLPGCGTLNSTGNSARKPYYERCHTDMECEMESRSRRSSKNQHSQPKWKLWSSIAAGVLVTGYLYAQRQDSGATTEALSMNKGIQPVTCGGECAR